MINILQDSKGPLFQILNIPKSVQIFPWQSSGALDLLNLNKDNTCIKYLHLPKFPLRAVFKLIPNKYIEM